MGLLERFNNFVAPEPISGCWLWMGYDNGPGYGMISIERGEEQLAHRVSYELFRGAIPPGLDVDHLCRVRCCVNPDHLEPVTRSVNLRRGVGPKLARERQLAKTHCPKGHPYSGDNLKVYVGAGRTPERRCRICVRAAWRAYREKKESASDSGRHTS